MGSDSEVNLLAPCKELAQIEMLSCDVDGVMTDGGLYYTDDGVRLWRFQVLDGLGLIKLREAGVILCVISQSRSPVIKKRAADLGIEHCYIGVEDKSVTVLELAAKLGVQTGKSGGTGAVRELCECILESKRQYS